MLVPVGLMLTHATLNLMGMSMHALWCRMSVFLMLAHIVRANGVTMVTPNGLRCHDSLSRQVDCWRERVSNVTELNQVIQDYPLLLSYSLDTSVSRLDFLIEVQYVSLDVFPKLYLSFCTRHGGVCRVCDRHLR